MNSLIMPANSGPIRTLRTKPVDAVSAGVPRRIDGFGSDQLLALPACQVCHGTSQSP